VPYALGVTGLIVVGSVAARWSRRGHEPQLDATEPVAPLDAGLERRLDDELSDLD
jgi:hypothetical protein